MKNDKSIRNKKGRFKIGSKGGFLGKKHSDETREKIRNSQKEYLKNNEHPMLGKHHSIESRKKMIESQKGKRIGEDNPRWKGGRSFTNGYVFVLKPNHPLANRNGYIAEHRLMAEKALGRSLKKKEIVHHVNGDKKDNRNKNFVISTLGYHRWLENRMAELYKKEHFGLGYVTGAVT